MNRTEELDGAARFSWKHLLLAGCASFALGDAAQTQCAGLTYPVGPGANGPVFASTEFAGSLYIGGGFDEVDGVEALGIARWDGQQWHPVGGGVPGTVKSMAVWDDGRGAALYVGGHSTTPGGGYPNPRVDRWDGTTWETVGTMDGDPTLSGGSWVGVWVGDLVVHDDGNGSALYAGGHFEEVDGVAASHVARWDGSQWSPLASGIDGTDSSVAELLPFDFGGGDELVAAGDFDTVSSVPGTRLVAHWDGSSWQALGSGLEPDSSIDSAQSLASFDSGTGPELIVGGTFEDPTSSSAFLLARWNGASFELFGKSAGNPIGPHVAYALQSASGGAELLIGGYFGSLDGTGGIASLASWDGSTFSAIPGDGGSFINTLTEHDDGSGTALFAGGRDLDFLEGGVGPIAINDIGRWNGTTWSGLGHLAQNLNAGVESLALFDDGSGAAMYVGGGFSYAGTLLLNHVARWDGSAWSALGAGLNGFIRDLEVHDDGNGPALYAGGTFPNQVARWDGVQWSSLGTGPGVGAAGVQAILSFDDGSGPALYATGNLGVKRWDGSAWSTVGTGAPSGWSMAGHDDGTGAALYVGWGQSFTGSSGGVEKWDGVSWTSMGSTDGRVGVMLSFDDGNGPALYAGGPFTTIGGAAATYLARWDGTGWSMVAGSPFTDRVKALAIYDDGSGARLAAGARTLVSLWDGTSWETLLHSPDIDGPWVLEAWEQELFVGQEHVTGILVWGPSFSCPPVGYCTAGTSASGCQALLSASGTASATAPSGFTLSAATVEGQKDGLFFFGTSGQQANSWGNGTSYQCVVPPVTRAGTLSGTGTVGLCDGSFAQDLNALWCPTCPKPAKNPGAGATVQAQLWYRDPLSTSNQTTSLSDAIEFVVGL